MLPEEDVPMPSTRFGLFRWFEREVSAPLTAMYAAIDAHLLDESIEQRPPLVSPKGESAPRSE